MMDRQPMHEAADRKFLILAAVVVCLIGVFYLVTIRTGHVWGDDHCMYIHHAKNIVEGREYGDTRFVRSPSCIAPLMYPPVFPLVLAPVYAAFGLALTPMKVELIGLFCVALFLFYLLLQDERPRWIPLSAIALTGFCPYFWDFKDSVYSEFLFLVFAFAALLTARRATGSQTSAIKDLLLSVTVGILSALAYGTRTAGIVLVPSVTLHNLAVRRRPTWFAGGVILSFLVVAWSLTLVYQTESDYLESYLSTFSLRELAASPVYYLRCFAIVWDNGYSGILQGLLYVLASALALYGGWHRFRSRQWAAVDIFALFHFVLIALFGWGGRRYLIPIIPVYLFYALLGFDRACSPLRARSLFVLRGLAIAVVAACFVGKYTTVDWNETPQNFDRPDTWELLDYLKHNVASSETVVFLKPRFLSLYANVRGAGCYENDSDDAVMHYYRGIGVSHVIVSALAESVGGKRQAFMSRLVAENRTAFQKTFENPTFTVYRILTDSGEQNKTEALGR